MDDFFCHPLISYVTNVYRLLLPKVYLIFAFFAQCLWLQVISLRQIRIPVISKNVVLVLS